MLKTLPDDLSDNCELSLRTWHEAAQHYYVVQARVVDVTAKMLYTLDLAVAAETLTQVGHDELVYMLSLKFKEFIERFPQMKDFIKQVAQSGHGIDPLAIPKIKAKPIKVSKPKSYHAGGHVDSWGNLVSANHGNHIHHNPAAGVYSNSVGRSPVVSKLPGIRKLVKHPVLKIDYYLEDAIINLNDSYKWTREQIADWLETLDIDLRFKGGD